jgi:hypothetical protein
VSLLAEGRNVVPRATTEVRNVDDLLGYWMGMRRTQRDISPATVANNRRAVRRLLRRLRSAVEAAGLGVVTKGNVLPLRAQHKRTNDGE